MDTQTRRDMETMAEWASTMDAYDRLLERRARRRRTLRFWFSPYQVADEPVVADAAPGEPVAPSAVSGAASGAVGSETPLSHTSTGFAGPAGPTTPTVRPVRGAGPATPHLEAVRISGAHTWT